MKLEDMFIPRMIDVRTEEKILELINAAESPEDIAGAEPQEGPVLDDPSRGYSNGRPGYDIGEIVAKRILNVRDEEGSLSTIAQIFDVGGLGSDKLNDLIYTFGPQYTRMPTASLSASFWSRYISAFNELIDSGAYEALADIHMDMSHNAHGFMGEVGQQRFLPWHRAYLLEMEKMLQAIDSSLFVPYWDWVNEREIPDEMKDFLGLSSGRSSVNIGWFLPSVKSVNDILMDNDEYTSFTEDLETGPHDRVHIWVGGDFADPMTAARDPLFWLHHANVDRYWHLWQQYHTDQDPTLTGADTIMDPWSYTAEELKHAPDLNYTYPPYWIDTLNKWPEAG